MKWINFLHFYQPPTATDEMIHEVVKSSYQSWADFLIKHSECKVTINFTACLTERLYNLGYEKLLNQFSELAIKGQIEFVESLAFHALAPLIPEKEVIKQIKINNEISKNRFGKTYQPIGFFLPEMAYSEKVGKVISELGYKYIILDEIALDTSSKIQVPSSKKNSKYKIKNTNLFVVFRNRDLSHGFVPDEILEYINKNSRQLALVTATDGELYGHRYWNWWTGYTEALKHLKTETLLEYLKNLKNEQEVEPRDCSWESTEDELQKNISFALWQHPKNKIHKLLWKLANFVLKLNYKNEDDENHFASRLHLESGLASCTFWWASGRDFKNLFGPKAWDPTFVEKGASELLNSIRSLNNISSRKKLKAEKLYRKIHELIWKKHWKKYE
ncbi:hypothetical protein ACFL1Y_00345 [Patescibacteria group bacterium]